jgi:hypothetical protein
MAIFWNGIVSVFVLLAIAGLYTNLIGPLPSWFPSPFQSAGNNSMPLGVTLFLCIFLTPFILIGLCMLGMLFLFVIGSVHVQLDGQSASVRTGIGPFRWRQRFDASCVRSVTIGRTEWQQNGKHKPVICIEADRTVKFGSMLSEERRNWLHAVLYVLLISPDPKRRAMMMESPATPRDYRRP